MYTKGKKLIESEQLKNKQEEEGGGRVISFTPISINIHFNLMASKLISFCPDPRVPNWQIPIISGPFSGAYFTNTAEYQDPI